jgi:acyl-CoA thioester hydrolase
VTYDTTRPGRGRPFAVDFDVRFPEVDSYGVVWHGHYVLYMEVARNALCAAAGLTPAEALEAGYKVPITKLDVQLKKPARLDDRLEVAAWLVPPEVAKLSMTYVVRRLPDREILATGSTEQVLLNPRGELLLSFPTAVKVLVERILAFQRGELDFPAPKIPLGPGAESRPVPVAT